jgi:thiol-disulfide isomerase/thioredoxin
MKRTPVLLSFLVISALLAGPASAIVAAQSADAVAAIPSPTGEPLDPAKTLILFYSDSCPHCHNQMRWMSRVREEFPDIAFEEFEIQVSNDQENRAYFAAVMDAFDSNTNGWPRTVIGDRLFIGFDPGEGTLTYNEQYAAWIGYRNQLYEALTELQRQQATR